MLIQATLNATPHNDRCAVLLYFSVTCTDSFSKKFPNDRYLRYTFFVYKGEGDNKEVCNGRYSNHRTLLAER